MPWLRGPHPPSPKKCKNIIQLCQWGFEVLDWLHCYYPRREGVPVPDRTWEKQILPIVAGCWWYLEAVVMHVSTVIWVVLDVLPLEYLLSHWWSCTSLLALHLFFLVPMISIQGVLAFGLHLIYYCGCWLHILLLFFGPFLFDRSLSDGKDPKLGWHILLMDKPMLCMRFALVW